jgi:hypothetical protein
LIIDIPASKEIAKVNVEQMALDFDVQGQTLQIEDSKQIIQFAMQEAVDENSPMRQQMNKIYF